ncbi:MAG: nucleotidyltransferase [Ruminococcus sp.]|nr:nucleotidyltransferase [Ruminococcus sp.]
MKSTTLIIMAAGIGSRYGKGIKQLEPVGPCGEIIMDYSVYDAVAAGFDRVVFIIRKDIEKEFAGMIGDRIARHVDVSYVFQETSDIPEKHKKIDRKKPWGTCHAVLCAKDAVHGAFAVINADDYYGREAFVKLHDYLVADNESSGGKLGLCMAGFVLKNTLSENGSVTRGVCKVDSEGRLADINETYNIRIENGKILSGKEEAAELDPDSLVSMNMWGCPESFMDVLESEFETFLQQNDESETAEFLLPILIGRLLKENKAECAVLESRDKWFGVTYKEDKPAVVAAIKALIDQGVYPEKLWED